MEYTHMVLLKILLLLSECIMSQQTLACVTSMLSWACITSSLRPAALWTSHKLCLTQFWSPKTQLLQTKTLIDYLTEHINIFPYCGMRLSFLALLTLVKWGHRSVNSTFVVLENTAKRNQYLNELPSDEGTELYHFLLCCVDIQTGKNMMASQRNISF